MSGSEPSKNKKSWSKMNFRSLKLSLKYRPELLKLILKMRQCIRKRNTLLKSLKHQLKVLEAKNTTEKEVTPKNSISISVSTCTKSNKLRDSATQTQPDNDRDETKSDNIKPESSESETSNDGKVNAGWNLSGAGDVEKSIAEQVKEAAQSALQDTGMVYVESVGMYYDYKTGYYYNSELGLYYHSDTGCYYYYSEDKQFVFHSYPDMSKVNSSLIAHQNKKARKLKRERKPEEDINVNNLTKQLSQDKEEDGSNPKKARKSKKKERKEEKKSKRDKKKKSKEDKIEDIHKSVLETDPQIDSKDPDKIDNNSSESKLEEINDSDSKDQAKSNNNDEDIFEINNDKEKEKADNSDDLRKKKNDSYDIEDKVQVTVDIKDEDKEDKKQEEMEDGECSDTGSEESDSGSESDASTSTVSDEDSVAKHHPPCMRVIVRETKLPKLKVGSLFLITKDGGTIGREGEQHAILLKDHNVSRNHLDIRYDMARKTYQATDLGSKNGSVLNGVRMSESQEASLPLDILHGSTIQLGETKLLCHIHPGHATCGQCEPGLLMQVEEEKKAAYTRTVSVKKQHELELARLKNIYAPQHLAIEEKSYNDRAQARREAVGSTNHAEKTQSTDLDTSIAPDNKGFKLLQKMGWSKGEGLGKDSQGDVEPVPLVSNEGKAGLGTTGAVAPPSHKPMRRVIKNNIASGTMRLAARTNMLQPPARAFQTDDDEECE